MVDFFYIKLKFCDLAKLPYPKSFLVDSLGFSMETVISANRGGSVSFFPVFLPY